MEKGRLMKSVGAKVQKSQLEELRELRKKRATLKKEQVGRNIKRIESIRLPRSQPRISYKKSRTAGRAITGVLGALMPQEALAGSVSFEKKGKKESRGRGRPHGTYKLRYLPDGRPVRVPTKIYRRMLSEYKAKRRLVEAQKQAKMQERYEAEQIAMQTDPRYQPSSDDQFLEEPDQEYEARLMAARQQQMTQAQYRQQLAQQAAQQQAMQRGGGFASKAGAMFGRLGGGLWGPQSQDQLQQVGQQGQQGQQVAEPYSAKRVQSIIRPQINTHRYGPNHPQVLVNGGKSIMFKKMPNLLGQANEFNRPADSVLEQGGVRRKW